MEAPNPALTVQQALDLAVQHHRAGRLAEAEGIYRRILAAEPNNAQALHLLGVLGGQVGQAEAGIQLIRRAIALQPDFADAYNNLGCALSAQDQPDEAIEAFRNALRLQSDNSSARLNLCTAMIQSGLADETLALFKGLLRDAPGWVAAHSNYLLILSYTCDDPVAILAEQRRWNQVHAQPIRSLRRPHANDPSVGRRLRIGYVSADFNDHPAGRNILPLLREHDRDRFEIYCYSSSIKRQALTDRMRACCNGWRDIFGVDDEAAAQMIRNDAIDILVDLSLHSSGSRLMVFAHKPAPVQATFIGYPAGTGLETIDYRLTDPHLDPPGIGDDHYVETSIRLPSTFWCYDPEGMELSEAPPVSAPPAIEGGAVSFGCLNGFWKFNDAVLALWAKVLAAVAGSRLIVLSPQGSARERLARKLASFGIEPNRIEFLTRKPRREYLNYYSKIDIGLDTFPYNGHSTSLDALWMGVPVVTLVGRTCVGRAGLSQLSNLNLPELAAQTPEQFVAIATKLAQDLPRLAELRSGLRQRMLSSPLMDARRFARDVESAYGRMWLKWRQQRTMQKTGDGPA
ncbi:MAG: tetratricopeptide repeat protein [Tepidisphaeraceae bacterium]